MRGWVFLNVLTGQMVPARCQRNSCAYCVRVNARRRGLAIAYARPERAVLLTQVGDSWQQARARMKRLTYRLRQEVGEVEWTWHVEPNPKGTGHHVHAWEHGAFLPQALLSRLAREVGMGSFARVNRIRSLKGASEYGLKGLTYGLKGAQAEDEGARYLSENGGRLTHQSRSFYRGADGTRLPVKEAERAATRSAWGSDGEAAEWVLTREA